MAAKYFLERRTLPSVEVAMDIARHLQVRQRVGTAVIIAEQPHILFSLVRKQWMKLVRDVQREWASTLDASLKAELRTQLLTMQELQFVTKAPYEAPHADIFFVNTIQWLPQSCATVYVTNEGISGVAWLLTEVQPRGVVVVYNGYTSSSTSFTRSTT